MHWPAVLFVTPDLLFVFCLWVGVIKAKNRHNVLLNDTFGLFNLCIDFVSITPSEMSVWTAFTQDSNNLSLPLVF